MSKSADFPRQEANRARKEAEGGPLPQTKRQWPGAVSPAAAPARDPVQGEANGEEAEVEEGEVKATGSGEAAAGGAQAEPGAEAGGNGAQAPKKARRERRPVRARHLSVCQ